MCCLHQKSIELLNIYEIKEIDETMGGKEQIEINATTTATRTTKALAFRPYNAKEAITTQQSYRIHVRYHFRNGKKMMRIRAEEKTTDSIHTDTSTTHTHNDWGDFQS